MLGLSTPSVSSIQEEDLNYLRYFLAVKSGRSVVVRVFDWSYQGGHPIKDYLLNQPGYSDKKFEKDFGPNQRCKLESSTPADVQSYDITLLYTLLQLVCGLAESTNPVWSTNGPTLENLLYRLKHLRNNVVHEEQPLTWQTLDTKLLALQKLFINIYQNAASRFGKSCLLVTQLTTEVHDNILGIKKKIRETLQPADLAELNQLQQEITIFGDQIVLKVKQTGFPELANQYQFLYMIEPAPWLRLSINFKPSLAFTELLIEEDEEGHGQPSQMKQARDVKCVEILRVTRKDGSTPNVIIMTGEEGIGKTTFLKYLIEKWIFDRKAVYDLDQVDILLYTQCQKSGIQSLDQLLKQLLDKTLQGSCVNLDFFRDTVLRLKTIIMIDGYNEADKDSEILLKNILQFSGNVRVIVTTDPQSKDHLIQRMPSGKCRLDLIVKGIAPELHTQYICNMIDVLVDQVDERAGIKESVNAKLKDLKITLGQQLNNSLTLTLLALLWVECPKKINSSTTVSELYEEIRGLQIESW